MPDHVIKVTYTEKLVRSAASKYWANAIGINGLISLVVIVLSCLLLAYLRVDSWIVGFFAGTAVICAAIVIITFFTVRKNSLSLYHRMGDRTATFTFSDTGLRSQSDNGSGEIAWKMIDKVIQHPDYWLFSIVKSSYFTLPIAAVPPETRAFILEHVRVT